MAATARTGSTQSPQSVWRCSARVILFHHESHGAAETNHFLQMGCLLASQRSGSNPEDALPPFSTQSRRPLSLAELDRRIFRPSRVLHGNEPTSLLLRKQYIRMPVTYSEPYSVSASQVPASAGQCGTAAPVYSHVSGSVKQPRPCPLLCGKHVFADLVSFTPSGQSSIGLSPNTAPTANGSQQQTPRSASAHLLPSRLTHTAGEVDTYTHTRPLARDACAATTTGRA